MLQPRHNDQSVAYGTVPVLRIDLGHELLLVQNHEGYWGFPKGHPDKGETAKQTAVRETCEETGICVPVESLGESFAYGYDVHLSGGKQQKTVTLFPFIHNQESVEIQAEEIQSYVWADLDKALELIDLPIETFLREVEGYVRSLR